MTQPIEGLILQIQNLRNRHRKLVAEVAGLQEYNERRSHVYKDCILALIALVDSDSCLMPSARREKLKALILQDAEMGILEQYLPDIKRLADTKDRDRSSDENQTSSHGCTPSIPSAAAVKEPSTEKRQLHLHHLQELFRAILTQVEGTSKPEDLEQFLNLRHGIDTCEDMDGLIALGMDVVKLLHTRIELSHAEQNRVIHFVAELSNNLVQMEGRLLSSMANSTETFKMNRMFNDDLQNHMENIKESIEFGKTIEEARSLVFSRLTTIETLLAEKRRQDEVLLQVSTQKVEELQRHLQSMRSEIDQVQKRTKTLEQEVLLDSLTGIHNRRAYELFVRERLQRYHTDKDVFSLILFDVDHFKKVNDQYGHRAGDKCLKEIINRIRPCIRKKDFLARYGGEEFIIVLDDTGKEFAYRVAEKIRLLVERTRFLYQGRHIPITISMGVIEVGRRDQEPEALFTRADKAMYRAKKKGRNIVCVA